MIVVIKNIHYVGACVKCYFIYIWVFYFYAYSFSDL